MLTIKHLLLSFTMFSSALSIGNATTLEATEKKIDAQIKLATKGKIKNLDMNADVLAFIKTGDIKAGKKVFKKNKCSRCHAQGIGDDEDTPNLAGQSPAYLFKQLYDFKSGTRGGMMQKKVKKLNAKSMADLTVYVETLEPVPRHKKGTIKELVKDKEVADFLYKCEQCHNKEKRDQNLAMAIPYIAGQKKDYIIYNLENFAAKARENDHWAVMRSVASQLNEKQIEIMADFYAAKPEEED